MRAAAEQGEAVFGNVDTWVIWNLTGGADGGVHVTDVTNASRTMLMDLRTLDWDDELLGAVRHPAADVAGHPVVVGAQRLRDHATRRTGRRRSPGLRRSRRSASGDGRPGRASQPGEAKNTYGTGNFMLLNTGRDIVPSKAGLLTTVCYRSAPRRRFMRSKDRLR